MRPELTKLGYRYPRDPKEYLVDPAAPIDRWFQAANSSNPATTVAIIRDLCDRYHLGPPTRMIDPFAGAGSAVLAARTLGLPLAGIEIDAPLTCVSLAKALASRRQLLPMTADAALFGAVLGVVREIRRAIGRPWGFEPVLDLLRSAPRRTPSHLVRGDARDLNCWQSFPADDGFTVIYCSPPFGHTAVAPWPAAVSSLATQVLQEFGLWYPGETSPDTSYGEIVVATLANAVRHIRNGLVILEHEPAHGGDDEVFAVTQQITASGLADVMNLFPTQNFSGKGQLSLIVCRIG